MTVKKPPKKYIIETMIYIDYSFEGGYLDGDMTLDEAIELRNILSEAITECEKPKAVIRERKVDE
jgi:hypothetical protein